jgi:uncharacterized protein (TIGR03382 family)
MKNRILSVVGLALAAGSAHATTTFSFASDSDHTSWTFRGVGNLVNDAQDRSDIITLLVDDGNGPLPALQYQVEFQFNGVLTFIQSVPLGGGQFLHTYALTGPNGGPGNFGFFLPNGDSLLTASFEGGVFSSQGGPGGWDSTAGASVADLVGAITYTWHGPDMPGYGLFSGQSSIGTDDAVFTFSFLNTNGDPGAPFGAGPYPGAPWFSEGSYSGTANFVPAPGALALLGLGGVVVGRRRR